MDVKELLEARVKSDLEKLESTKLGSDERKALLAEVTELTDRLNAMEDVKLKAKKQKGDHVISWVDTGATVVKVLGGFAITAWGTIVALNYEKTDVLTMMPSKKHLDSLLGAWKK